jgi:hypothetical protein
MKERQGSFFDDGQALTPVVTAPKPIVGRPEPEDGPAIVSRPPAPDRSIQRAAAGARAWFWMALACLESIAVENEYCTSDDVWTKISSPPDGGDARALGAVFRRAEADGIIKATNEYKPSERKGCHHRPIRVWQSLVYGRR